MDGTCLPAAFGTNIFKLMSARSVIFSAAVIVPTHSGALGGGAHGRGASALAAMTTVSARAQGRSAVGNAARAHQRQHGAGLRSCGSAV